MSESLQHQQLVKMILDFSIEYVGPHNKIFISTDSINSISLPPVTIDGFRPDVYYQFENTLIIGEAKTSKDVERIHSIEQYESYIKMCSMFQGTAVLVLAVPWTDHATIHNIIYRIKKKYKGHFDVRILDGIGGAI